MYLYWIMLHGAHLAAGVCLGVVDIELDLPVVAGLYQGVKVIVRRCHGV